MHLRLEKHQHLIRIILQENAVFLDLVNTGYVNCHQIFFRKQMQDKE